MKVMNGKKYKCMETRIKTFESVQQFYVHLVSSIFTLAPHYSPPLHARHYRGTAAGSYYRITSITKVWLCLRSERVRTDSRVPRGIHWWIGSAPFRIPFVVWLMWIYWHGSARESAIWYERPARLTWAISSLCTIAGTLRQTVCWCYKIAAC